MIFGLDTTRTPMDVRMVILLSAVIPLVLGGMMFVYWRTRKTYHGFGRWTSACFLFGIGYMLMAARNEIPAFFSIILGNAFTLYGLILLFDGIQLFFERRGFDPWNHAIFAAYALAQLFFTYIQPEINLRIVMISFASFILEFRAGVSLVRGVPARLRPTSTIIAIIFYLSALVSLLRMFYGLSYPQPIDMTQDATLVAIGFASICSITVWTFYLFFLNNARLEFELMDTQQGLASIVAADRHKVIQLGLLEATSRILVQSLDEREIIQRTIEAVVNKFGYAIAAFSLLVDGDNLEVIAIDGTEHPGYVPGYRQKIGEGIIGYTADQKTAYIAEDIERDPYYFTIGKRSGSAAGLPILDDGQLLGVLYVESSTRNAFDQEDIQALETLIGYTVIAIQKARLYQRVQVQLRAISTLQSTSHVILSSLELSQVFQSVVSILKRAFNYTYVTIYLLDRDTLRLEAQAGYQEDEILQEIPTTSGITGRCVQEKQTQFIQDVNLDPVFLRAAYDVGSEICVPLVKDEDVLGVINVEEAPGHPLTDNDVSVLTALVGPVVVAIENARLHAKVKELALTDGLTNLYNRRAFDQMLEVELERASRYNYSLALVIIDLDHFKEFNDRWGHPAGDERLKAIAEFLRLDLRTPDVVARYGGDEFALILPHTDKARAMTVAERLRAAAEKKSLEHAESDPSCGRFTFSMGVAVFPEDAGNLKDLLFAADQAELLAKTSGKNRVYSASIPDKL